MVVVKVEQFICMNLMWKYSIVILKITLQEIGEAQLQLMVKIPIYSIVTSKTTLPMVAEVPYLLKALAI